MKAISLFSGAGGLDLGFAAAGIGTVIACEWNRDAVATFRANISDDIHAGDVRDLIPRLHEGAADILFGGPPCQGLSIAGKMNPEDPRSSLIGSFLDAVGRVRPRAFVMENVDALLGMSKWAGLLASVRERAGALGYGIHCFVLNAADYGVPQARRRFFAIGILGSDDGEVARQAEPMLEALRLPMTPAMAVFKRLGPQGTVENPTTSKAIITVSKNPVLRRTAYAGMLFNGAGRPIDPSRPAPTITASAGGNKTHIVDEEQVFGSGRAFCETWHAALVLGDRRAPELPASLRRLTIEESRAFQTFPDGFRFNGPTSSQYRQIGNAVPVKLAEIVATAVRSMLENGAKTVSRRSEACSNMAA